jgi:hypothetical protein
MRVVLGSSTAGNWKPSDLPDPVGITASGAAVEHGAHHLRRKFNPTAALQDRCRELVSPGGLLPRSIIGTRDPNGVCSGR